MRHSIREHPKLKHSRLFLAAAVGAAAALVLSMTMGAFASGNSGTLDMAANSQLGVTCPNALSNMAVAADSETVVCAADPATTTTTAPATTTTTVPVTTTTTPPPTTSPTTTPPTTTGGGGGGSSPCPQFLTEPSATQAFCDTMSVDQAMPGSRTGSLDPVLWGVDRWTGNDNPSENPAGAGNESFPWPDSTQNQCGTSTQVSNLDDINVCDGETVESSNDNGSVSTLAMYPRQPFNFAGRTGVVEFNVSDNSQQSHAAWPTMVISDQPVPAPMSDTAIDGVNVAARNSIGVDFVGNGTSNPHCVTAMIWETTNYVANVPDGSAECAVASTSVTQMNHVEVQVSSTGVSAYMSDAGTDNMVLVAQANFTVPLTQGLVWLEDAHYNGDKFGTQQTDTFGWNDLAFDGPVEPRDLGFDVLDNTLPGPTAESGQPTTQLGYHLTPSCCWTTGNTGTVTAATGPTQGDIDAASGALIVLDTSLDGSGSITYAVNGHSNSYTPQSQAVALPVPLSELVPGPNTITFGTGDGNTWGDLANVDLILQGAGGIVQP